MGKTMIIETVKIKTKAGDVVINKTDFDAKKHTLAGVKRVTKKKVAKKK